MSGVEQQDREAAAEILMKLSEAADSEAQVMLCREAFARHRHEARKAGMKELLTVCEGMEFLIGEQAWYAKDAIIAAIRSAIGGENPSA